MRSDSAGWTRFGFYGSGYKYGTYVGILAPLCAVYLLEGGGWKRVGGAALLLGAVVSCATLGALTGIAGGIGFLLEGQATVYFDDVHVRTATEWADPGPEDL